MEGGPAHSQVSRSLRGSFSREMYLSVYLLSSKEPTTVKALGTVLHNAFRKKGESDEPLPVLMY